MTKYTNDPRVVPVDRGLFTVTGCPDRQHWDVYENQPDDWRIIAPGGGPDPRTGVPAQFRTEDDAIHSLIGNPQETL
jgi:hypothetical protein